MSEQRDSSPGIDAVKGFAAGSGVGTIVAIVCVAAMAAGGALAQLANDPPCGLALSFSDAWVGYTLGGAAVASALSLFLGLKLFAPGTRRRAAAVLATAIGGGTAVPFILFCVLVAVEALTCNGAALT